MLDYRPRRPVSCAQATWTVHRLHRGAGPAPPRPGGRRQFCGRGPGGRGRPDRGDPPPRRRGPGLPQRPQPPELPDWPQIQRGAEIVIAHEHILESHQERVAFLARTPRVAQMCALAGAIQWSLFRDLAIRQLYLGVPSYFVPVYLQSREDITQAPDLIAPVQVQGERLYVRTALEPYMGYAWARVVATRHDQLPHWLVTAWHDRASEEDVGAFENVEREELASPSGPEK